MEKTCVHCQETKNLSEFHFKKSTGRHNSWCKKCVYRCQRQRWKARKIKVVYLMGGKCQKCGYNKNASALDFHHKDPSQKEYDFSTCGRMAWPKVVEEMKKCILLCRNCHAEHHHPELVLTGVPVNSDSYIENSFLPTGKCEQCGKPVYGTKFCGVQCACISKRKVTRPRKKTLEKLISTKSFCAIGREYGVTDNTVRKWAKGFDISCSKGARPDAGKSNHSLYHMYKRLKSSGRDICTEWLENFNVFARDIEALGPRPADAGLGRINSDKAYGPGNCKWIFQGKRFIVDGEDMSIGGASRKYGIPHNTLALRVSKGMSLQEAVRK